MESAAQSRRMEKAKKYLRLFLADTPELNRLTRDEESSNELLELAIILTVDDWNSTTPMLSPVTIENYPSLFLLLHGATIQVLKTQGLYQARNELQYSTGGSSFTRHNKTQIYQAWLVNFSNEYEMKKRNYKISQNIDRGWGGVNSEYDRIGYAW